MRLFLALTPPDAILDRLEALQSEIPVGRPVPRENLHVTLAFLGEVDPTGAEALHDELARIAAPALEIAFAGLGSFGRPDPAVVFAAVARNAALVALHRKLRAAAHAAGLMPDRERFHPHVTLARFGRGLGPDETLRLARFLSAWGAVSLPAFTATGFSLFESHLGKGGARYDALAAYPMGRG
ncbi:MAG: RNA 2',3'-cyclic phosphodiesterase [Paracoccaceae bacterium]